MNFVSCVFPSILPPFFIFLRAITAVRLPCLRVSCSVAARSSCSDNQKARPLFTVGLCNSLFGCFLLRRLGLIKKRTKVSHFLGQKGFYFAKNKPFSDLGILELYHFLPTFATSDSHFSEVFCKISIFRKPYIGISCICARIVV